jgi:putative two-component system response regulator
MKIFYVVCLLLAVVLLLAYLYYNTKDMDSLVGIVFFSVVVSNWGNLMMASSKTLEELLLGKKISYFGSSIIMPASFLLILSICNFNISKKFKLLIYVVSCLSFGLVSTIGNGNLYYSNEKIVFQNGVAMLKKDGEIFHTIYFMFLLSFVIMSVSIVIYTYVKKMSVSKRNIILFASMAAVNFLIFVICRMIHSEIEIMPLIYVVDATILFYIMQRISLYNVENSVVKSLLEERTLAYLVLDKDRKYITSNDVAKALFPEISEFRVDQKINIKDNEIFTLFSAWINELDENSSQKEIVGNCKKGDVALECRIKYMYYRKKVIGYILEVADNTDKQNYLELMQTYNSELLQEVERKTKNILDMQDKILFAVGNMVENRDMSTGGHINRTSFVVGVLLDEIKKTNELQMDDDYIKNIIKVAPLHDLGKISIDDSILKKPGKFTDDEFEQMKTHSVKGAEIVERILKDIEDEELVNIAVNIARHHHEKWNGCGYPDKLVGDEIPFEARVMAVADVYDALVSDRCYKKKMSFEQADKIILESMGSHFDPSLEKYYLKVRDKLEVFYTTNEGMENVI